MERVRVKVKKIHPNAVIPQYKTSGSAGFDLYTIEDVEIQPGETKQIRTGLIFEIPEGYEIQIRPRSGMSLKTPLRISNAPGTIDSDYRGEVMIIAENTSIVPFSVEKGTRIAQGVLQKVPQAEFIEVEKVSETERGEGGFGSTGIK